MRPVLQPGGTAGPTATCPASRLDHSAPIMLDSVSTMLRAPPAGSRHIQGPALQRIAVHHDQRVPFIMVSPGASKLVKGQVWEEGNSIASDSTKNTRKDVARCILNTRQLNTPRGRDAG